MADRYFEVNKINVRYGDIQVLWDIEFTADKGEIVALVGSNGAGKSTTVKSCAGLISPFREISVWTDMILPERLAEPLLTTGLSWFRRAGSCFLP